jgi:hypothetical protein
VYEDWKTNYAKRLKLCTNVKITHIYTTWFLQLIIIAEYASSPCSCNVNLSTQHTHLSKILSIFSTMTFLTSSTSPFKWRSLSVQLRGGKHWVSPETSNLRILWMWHYWCFSTLVLKQKDRMTRGAHVFDASAHVYKCSFLLHIWHD